jgi:Cellulose binding domain
MRTGSRVPGGRRWLLPAGAATVVVLAGSGAALMMFSPAPATHPLADGCGLVACDASLPPSVTGTAERGTPHGVRQHRPAHPPVSPKPTASAASRAPQPGPTPQPPGHRPPSPAPRPSPTGHPPGPRVTVTYTLDDGADQWHHAFRAHLTIASSGRKAVAGWTIELSLPGDHINWVGYPGAPQPFAVWQMSGNVLVLHAVSSGETLAPGGTEIVQIVAEGPHTFTRSCTFNGAGCRP